MKRTINENWKFLNLCFEAFSLLMCLALAVASDKKNVVIYKDVTILKSDQCDRLKQ